MDIAILNHEEVERDSSISSEYKKIDEIPFDFNRRRMSVVVEDSGGRRWLICKGAVEEIMSLCTKVELDNQILPAIEEHNYHRRKRVALLNSQGFRVVAIAFKEMSANEKSYTIGDETDMVLMGFLAFLDPPKESAPQGIEGIGSLSRFRENSDRR